jgi:hypothetical protein
VPIDEPRSYGASADNAGLIAAPVTYKDTMLIVVRSDGVAAIVFGKPIERGITYRFRFLRKDSGNEITGHGSVFERYRGGHYDGGRLTILAGTIRIGWSAGDEARGWVYYEPESLRLQIASAKRFEDSDADGLRDSAPCAKLDLKRFFKQP